MLPGFFSPCKTIDMCHKFFIILVSITRPNSTKIMTCSNICDYPKQIICSQILSYKTVVSSFTGRCKSTRQSPGLPWRKSFPCKGRASMHCPSTISSWEIPNMSGAKSSTRGAPPRDRTMRHAFFLLFSQAYELRLSYFFSLLFPFSCSRCCGLGANLICRLIFSHHCPQQYATHPFQWQS